MERAEPPRAKGSAERSSDPLQDRSATPEVDPEEAAIEDSPSGVNDSAERLRQPEDRTLMATSWLLPAVPTSTGVDTGALPTTDLEQAVWDASVMHVSTGADADGNSMAVVSVADGPTSTGEGAAGTTRTRTRDSDGGASSEQENSSSRLISVEESFDIVGGRPRTGTAESPRATGFSHTGSVGTRHPFTTSYDNSAYGTQEGESSGPDDKPSLRGADEHSYEHPARSCLRDRCGHATAKRARPSPSSYR